MVKMRYERPELVVYGEEDVAEWAVPQKPFPKRLAPVACERSNPADCHCTMGQARAMAPSVGKLRVATSCHCTMGGSRVTHEIPKASVRSVMVA